MSTTRGIIAGGVVAAGLCGGVLLAGEAIGPDVTFCQLYGLKQFGREGDVVGLALTTTSWNIGDKDLIWEQSPDPDHPFIVMNLYRILDGRFEQIGQSWVKHGFFALAFEQCGGDCTFEPGHSGGNWLGQNCTDTYGAGLNADQDTLGPRFEINPWTGGWAYSGSVFQQGGPSNNEVTRRLQVHDDDLDPALNPGAVYIAEGYYVHKQDIDVWNSVSWKVVEPVGEVGGDWTFLMTGENDFPSIGFAIDAWEADSYTVLAQEIPVIEGESPDGRCLLGVEATDLGDGFHRFTYTLLNIDMDRQVDSFSLPIAPGSEVRNLYFHAVAHHDEPTNAKDAEGGVPIDNAPWEAIVTDNAISWETDSNPLRWGTAYTFEFEINEQPDQTNVTLGLFKTGDIDTVSGPSLGPALEPKVLGLTIVDAPGNAVEPGAPAPVLIEVTAGTEQIGSINLRYRAAGETDFASAPFVSGGGDLYEGAFPALACGPDIEWYIEGIGDLGGSANLPKQAPDEYMAFTVGQFDLAADDAMEDGQGDWVVGAPGDNATGGIWELADPEITIINSEVIQPGDDHTPGLGTMCWVTGAAAGANAGSNDVDDGKTTLTSPTYDLTGADSATISYYRWYSNAAGQAPELDVFEVLISSDGGQNWLPLETVGPDGAGTSGGWYHAVFNAGDFIPLTDQVKLRFIASDTFAGSLVEAAVDDLTIETFRCEDLPPPVCPEDLDGSGFIDSVDLNIVLGSFGLDANGDIDGDGDTDSDDLNALLTLFGVGCEG